MEHIPAGSNPYLLREIWRVARRGALFWLAAPALYNFAERHPDHRNLLKPSALIEAIRNVGFEVVRRPLQFNISLFTPFEWMHRNKTGNSTWLRRFLKSRSTRKAIHLLSNSALQPLLYQLDCFHEEVLCISRKP